MRDNSLVQKLRVMELLSWATCKGNICPTSCTEISLWKRPISNSYKLFSSYRTVFSTESSWDSKTSDLNCFYEALAQREALAICQDRVFASFLCALSLRSVFGRSIHMYWTIPEKKTNWELRIWTISRVIEEIASGFSVGLLEATLNFQEWSRKNHAEYPGVLVLALKVSVGCNTHTILWSF